MAHPALFPPIGDLTPFEALTLQLEDARPHPDPAALTHLGHVIMTELLDLLADTALEDFQTIVCESLIGAFHSAAQRIERDADKGRDVLNGLIRDFDGAEVLDTEIQAATRKTQAADVATLAIEMVRDAASATYATATGEVWSPWKGAVKASRTTLAQVDAREALRARKARRHAATDPGSTIVAFRAAPQADTQVDANRIFDALNWAQGQWPDMTLATTGAKGGEKLAIKWAASHGARLVLARADFDRNGRAAPFRANDELLELEPVCVLTLVNSLDAGRGAGLRPFGPALNLAQKAAEQGIRHHAVRSRP
ncbi:MAG TPA: DUF2493 domain-containing protein [Phenylobacterium sp.]